MNLIKSILSLLLIVSWLCPLAFSQEAPAANEAAPPPPPAMEQPPQPGAPSGPLAEMQKKNRELSQKLNERKKALFRDNEEVKKIQTEIKNLHDKIDGLLSADPEYSKLKTEQQALREKMQEQYRNNRPQKDSKDK